MSAGETPRGALVFSSLTARNITSPSHKATKQANSQRHARRRRASRPVREPAFQASRTAAAPSGSVMRLQTIVTSGPRCSVRPSRTAAAAA